MYFTIRELVDITNGILLNEGTVNGISDVTTDSRKADGNSLFIPLHGETKDGHEFIENACKNGCKVVLCDIDVPLVSDVTFIKVKDTMIAMGDIAREHIKRVAPKKIAITGSVGKTTTKELVASVFEKIDTTLKTQGNFNNNIGLPLTAFRLNNEKIAVFEMGMNHFGEIDYLTKIVVPDIAIITNIGYSHMENLGSREGILKAKCEVLNSMSNKGVVILNGDDEFLYSLKGKINQKIIFYGINNKDVDYYAYNIKEEEGKTSFTVNDEKYEINLTGKHNVYNALSAISAGFNYTDDVSKIKEGLISYHSDGMRQNIVEKNGYKVIVDCYNAAPDSLLASLNVLEKTKGERKIAVFGSVAELGEKRDELLYEVGKSTKKYKVDILITVSQDALAINKGAKEVNVEEMNFSSNKEVSDYLKGIIRENDVVLVKGSRLYKMEEISNSLIE